MSTTTATLGDIERRYDELERLLSDPEVATDPARLQEYGRERAEMDEVVGAFRELREVERAIDETQEMAADPEMADLVQDELRRPQIPPRCPLSPG
jgi:peptide chain release factor 1